MHCRNGLGLREALRGRTVLAIAMIPPWRLLPIECRSYRVDKSSKTNEIGLQYQAFAQPRALKAALDD